MFKVQLEKLESHTSSQNLKFCLPIFEIMRDNIKLKYKVRDPFFIY